MRAGDMNAGSCYAPFSCCCCCACKKKGSQPLRYPADPCGQPWVNGHCLSRAGAVMSHHVAVKPGCKGRSHAERTLRAKLCVCCLPQAADDGDVGLAQQLWCSLQAQGLRPSHRFMNSFLV